MIAYMYHQTCVLPAVEFLGPTPFSFQTRTHDTPPVFKSGSTTPSFQIRLTPSERWSTAWRAGLLIEWFGVQIQGRPQIWFFSIHALYSQLSNDEHTDRTLSVGR